MLKKILVPTDGSKSAIKAVTYARQMLQEGIAEKITLLHVGPAIEERWGYYGLANADVELRYQCVLSDEGKRILRISKRPFEEAGLPVEVIHLCGDSAETIISYAEENKFDLIVIGSRGLNKLAELLLGSVCDRVIRLSTVPVLIVR
ncbi:MAG: universal stress protein [Bacillota bacterium]|jgi:nucleotide-binding universal stress UspA family protein